MRHDTAPDPLQMIRPRRPIVGMSAVLLPHVAGSGVDWAGLAHLLERTVSAGLVPAVNMDTGFGQLLSPGERREVLDVARVATEIGAGPDRFVAGVHVRDEPGAPFDPAAYAAGLEEVAAYGGTPVVFPSWGLRSLVGGQLVEAHEEFGEVVDRFLGFELGEMFVPEGRIWSLAEYRDVMAVPACAGAKHSSLARRPEWERLRLRDAERPDFMVLTGNDLAIDMVVYGSDWLLGLSTFAPDAFAIRDRLWMSGDPGFWEVNDLLQYLGQFAFRRPVSGYRHNAAQFLRLRGWIESAEVPADTTRRPASDVDVLAEILDRLDGLLADHAGKVGT